MVRLAKAKEMIMTGAMLNAQEAHQIGLVNKEVEADKFEEKVTAFAGSLTRGLGVALKEAKKLINLGLVLADGLSVEVDAFSNLFSTEGFRKGTAAFLEKRKPSFKGK